MARPAARGKADDEQLWAHLCLGLAMTFENSRGAIADALSRAPPEGIDRMKVRVLERAPSWPKVSQSTAFAECRDHREARRYFPSVRWLGEFALRRLPTFTIDALRWLRGTWSFEELVTRACHQCATR